MDRQEYRDITGAIKTNFKKKDYERVIMYAREIPAKKIKENNVLEMIATAYEQLGKPNLARNTLEVAYKRMPGGKHTAYKLAVVSLKMKDIEGAIGYYEDFCRIAPNDSRKFLLKYEIAKAGKLEVYDKIRILEEYTAKETDDKWMYELARLYHEAGMGDKCADMCDEIIIWFSDGDYLKRALELKFAHKALTPEQQAMYENIMQDYIEDYEEPEPVVEEPSPVEEKEAEEFANDFLGDDEAQALYGNTRPLDVDGINREESHTKTIGLSEPHREKAQKSVSEIADSKKNIFYDFRIEDAKLEPDPGLNAWINTLPDIRDEEFKKSMQGAADEVLEAEDEADEISEATETLEAENAAEEIPERRHTYSPALESIRETPGLNEDFEHKKLEAGDGQLDVNFDLLHGDENEVDGQMSIDQMFQTYANNIENNLENRAAVAKIEAERLRQIKEAVENSMPASPVVDFDDEDEFEGEPEASGETDDRFEDEQQELSEDEKFGDEPETFDEIEEKQESLFEDDPGMFDDPENDFDGMTDETEVEDDETFDGRQAAFDGFGTQFEDGPDEFFKDEKIMESYSGSDDPVERILDELVQKEPAKEKADAESGEQKEDKISAATGNIEIPSFLKNLQFKEEDEEELYEEDDEIITMSTEDVNIDEESDYDEEAAEAETLTEDENVDEQDEEIPEEDIKIKKSEEEIDEELSDLGDFLTEVMGRDEDEIEALMAQEEIVEDETISDDEIKEMSDKVLANASISKEDEEDLDELGDALADIFSGENEEVSEIEETSAADDEQSIDVSAIEAEIADIENIATDDEEGTEELESFIDEIADDEDDESDEDEPDDEDVSEEDAEEEIEEEDEEEPDEETDLEEEAEEADNKEEESDADDGEESDDEDAEEESDEDITDDSEEDSEVEEDEDDEEEIIEDESEADEDAEGDLEAEEDSKEAEEDSDEDDENGEAEPADAVDGTEDSEDDVEVKEETLDDTQPLERVQKFSLDEETKEEIAEFLLIDGMREVVTKAVNDVIINKKAGDTSGGNLIVTGDAKCGKTFLAISIIKAVNKELQSGSGKVAKVQSESLNGKDIEKVFKKIAGNDLIIENVGYLEEKTIDNITKVLQDGIFKDMLVLEGNMLAVETILSNHPEMEALFENRVDISELSISQWADVACDYAKRKGYRVGDMALLALHAKIDEINLPTRRFGYEDVVNIMEEAIERCDKRNTGKLFSAFSKKEEEGIELNESDFA